MVFEHTSHIGGTSHAVRTFFEGLADLNVPKHSVVWLHGQDLVCHVLLEIRLSISVRWKTVTTIRSL